VEKEIDEKGIELSVDLDPHLPEMRLDAIQVQQILLNLIRSASGFLGPDRKVLLKSPHRAATLNHCPVEVDDNGS